MINFFGNVIMIPKMLAIGSAYSSLITQFTTAVVQVILAVKVFKMKLNFRYVFTLLLYVIGVAMFNMLSRIFHVHIPFIPEHLSWMGGFLLMILASVVLALTLRLWSVSSLLRILRTER